MIVTLQTQGLQTLAAGATVDLNAQDEKIQRKPSLISTYDMPPHTAKKSKITIRRAPAKLNLKLNRVYALRPK